MERACILMEKTEIDNMIDLFKEFIHIPSKRVRVRNQTLEKLYRPVNKVKKINQRACLTNLMDDFCNVTGLTQDQLKSSTRKRKLADARFVFSIIAIDEFGATERELAILINRDHSRINQYKKEMECPQKMELYLKIKSEINTLPYSHK